VSTSTQQTDEGEHDASLARITPWQRDPSFAVLQNHVYPRWRVSLRASDDAVPLFRRVKADLRVIRQQIDADALARIQDAQRQYASGDVTPNQRSLLLAEAEQERATRLARVEEHYTGLDEDAALQRNHDSAQAAITATWRDAIAAYNATHAA